MNEILLCTIFGVFILVSFTIGLAFGCKLRNGEAITIPSINPVKVVKERKKEKIQREKEEKEQEIFEQNLANIDAYDGTETSQKDFD